MILATLSTPATPGLVPARLPERRATGEAARVGTVAGHHPDVRAGVITVAHEGDPRAVRGPVRVNAGRQPAKFTPCGRDRSDPQFPATLVPRLEQDRAAVPRPGGVRSGGHHARLASVRPRNDDLRRT